MDPNHGASEPAEAYIAFVQQQLQQLNGDLVDGQALEVMIPLATGERLIVSSFSFHNPDLIKVHGRDKDGNDMCLVAHKSTLQVVLRRVGKRNDVNPEVAFQDPSAPKPEALFEGTA